VSEIIQLDAAQLAAKIAGKELSSTEVTQACVDQIEATDGEYHAFWMSSPLVADTTMDLADDLRDLIDFGRSETLVNR